MGGAAEGGGGATADPGGGAEADAPPARGPPRGAHSQGGPATGQG